jgi:hypothetical protein
LLDGFYHLAKAYLLGVKEIPAVQFSVNPERDWLKQTL